MRLFKNIKYGWWSENCFINIPAVYGNFTKGIINKSTAFSVNLVGSIILGRQLFAVKVSKHSLIICLSL